MFEEDATETERAHASGLKVHLRELVVGRATYRVVTLRPGTTARFSTNFFHGTWHILTDREGAFVLARLLWGLAFQRMPNTLVVLDAPHLVRTPFEADPAPPVLLACTGSSNETPLDGELLRQLRLRLRRVAPTRTIRFHTFGLGLAEGPPPRWSTRALRERVVFRGGLVCYGAPPEVLRERARRVHLMRHCRQMDYEYLAQEGSGYGDGEIQVFRDFCDMVSVAAVARRHVVHEREGSLSEAERAAIYREAVRVEANLRACRRL